LGFLVCLPYNLSPITDLWLFSQPFVDLGHPLHDLFPPRVWAIRIPVIIILLGSAVVGSFLSVVMIKSNRKKAAKAKAAAQAKKKT
jgi:dolichol phosphate-mannose biosynthesis regulatory protein